VVVEWNDVGCSAAIWYMYCEDEGRVAGCMTPDYVVVLDRGGGWTRRVLRSGTRHCCSLVMGLPEL
jgi:hypothetical protein